MPRSSPGLWLALALLGGPRASHAADYVDRPHGFAIAVPSGYTSRQDFSHSYLDGGTWKVFADPASQGQPLLALTLPGSNELATGELRIGASTRPQELAHCADPPAEATDQPARAWLGGVAFTRVHAADAAMMHVLQAESYRAVHHGRCYAIDLLFRGINPGAYDPPRQPPFDSDQAFTRLRALLRGLRFLD